MHSLGHRLVPALPHDIRTAAARPPGRAGLETVRWRPLSGSGGLGLWRRARAGW